MRSDAVGALIYLDGFEYYPEVKAIFDDSYTDQDEELIFIALQQFGLFDLTGDLKEASERQVFNDIPAMLDPVRAARSGIKHLKQLEQKLLDAWWKADRNPLYPRRHQPGSGARQGCARRYPS